MVMSEIYNNQFKLTLPPIITNQNCTNLPYQKQGMYEKDELKHTPSPFQSPIQNNTASTATNCRDINAAVASSRKTYKMKTTAIKCNRNSSNRCQERDTMIKDAEHQFPTKIELRDELVK